MNAALRRPSIASLVVFALAGCPPPGQGSARTDAECPPPREASVSAEVEAEPAPERAPIDGAARTMSARDLTRFDRISDPQVSPDGRRVAFVLRYLDPAANRGRTDLWVVSIDGGQAMVLAEHPAADSSPRWSPDGRSLFFLSRRGGASQVWQVDADGGAEPRAITSSPVDVDGFVVSPDGQTLALFAEVFVECETLRCTADRLAAAGSSPRSGKVYERLFVRHWDTWEDGRRSHVFVVPVAGGEPIDVTAGMDADVPSRPFGGDDEVAFTPDGERLVFAARDAGAGEAWSTNFDLFVAPIDRRGDAGTRENLTKDNPAWDTRPIFSPDGKTLIYLAMSRPGYEADRFRIMARSWPEGQTREIAAGWDRSPSDLLFSADGKTLYATADDLGRHSLFAIDVASGEVREVHRGGHVSAPRLAGDGLVVLRDDLQRPAELFHVGLDGGEPRPITAVNRDRLAPIRMGEAEPFTFTGWKKDTVHGWVVKPADFKPGERYPVAFLIHGGPQGSFGDHFHYRWNPQVYAGAGYATVMIDFHGSTGYGQAFTDAIGGNWGGGPLEDLKLGLKAATDRFDFLDSDRVCALGASYGGFMVNWIAGQWSDRFRCLVNHDGVFDQRMMYYATEELWFPEREHGSPYWQDPAAHERWNPAAHVGKWKTPMLVIHGSLDYRIPDTQGIGAFTALQRRGVPSKLVIFPDENHWVLQPANSEMWHEEVLGWLDTWLRPKAG